MRALILMVALVLGGCEPSRHRPEQQAEDYKLCTSAGMEAFLNGYSEVRCKPPGEVKP